MPITRKPKTPLPSDSTKNTDVEALIAKGGTVASSASSETEKKIALSDSNSPTRRDIAFTLRVPAPLLNALDTHLQKRPFKVPRQQWILEAIVRQLEKESNSTEVTS